MAHWKRWLFWLFRTFGVLFLAFVAYKFCRAGYGYGLALWNSSRAFSYLKDWLPAVVGVTVGILPGTDWEKKIRARYRVLIVVVGFAYSAILWRSETLSDKDNKDQINQAVQTAVDTANKHTDKQINGVDQHVGSLEGEVKGVNKQQVELAQDFEKATGAINTSLGKVGKPDPIPPARLVFTLWSDTASVEHPLLVESLPPDKDGNFPVEFTLANASETTAEQIDLFLDICQGCSFAKEPEGFENPPGNASTTRHRIFASLNPTINMAKMTALIKAPSDVPWFEIAVRYSCKTCGGKQAPKQTAKIVRESIMQQ